MRAQLLVSVMTLSLMACAPKVQQPVPVVVGPSVLDSVVSDEGRRGAAPLTKAANLVPASADAVAVIDFTLLGESGSQLMGSPEAVSAFNKDLKAVFGRLLGPDLSEAEQALAWMNFKEEAVGFVLDGSFGRAKLKTKEAKGAKKKGHKKIGGIKAFHFGDGFYLAPLGAHMVLGNEAAIGAMVAVHKRKRPSLRSGKGWKSISQGMTVVQGKKPVIVASVGPGVFKEAFGGTPLEGKEVNRLSIGIGADISLRAALDASRSTRMFVEGLVEQGREEVRGQATRAREAAMVDEDLIEAVANVVTAHSLLAGAAQLKLRTEGEILVGTFDPPSDVATYMSVTSIGAAVAIPAFIKYVRRAKTTEAIDQMDRIYKAAAIYYTTPHVNSRGEKLPCQFPATQLATPRAGTCCSSNGLSGPDKDGNDRCDPDPSYWNTPTWSALNFQIPDEHYFVYSFESSGVLADAGFTITANADLDCDGVQSTFQRMGFGDPEANMAECSLRGSAAFYVEKETE